MSKNVYPNPNGRYFRYKFAIEGRVFSGSTKQTNERDALRAYKAIRARIESQLVIERVARGKQVGVAADMPLDYAIEAFFTEHVEAEGLAGPKEIQRRLFAIMDHFGKETMVSDVGDVAIQKFIQTHARRPSEHTGKVRKPRSIRTDLAEIKRFLNWVRDKRKVPMQIIDWKGLLKSKLLVVEDRERVLSVEEEAIFIRHAPEDKLAAVRFALASGLRRANFIELLWSQVDFSKGIISVRQKGQRKHKVIITDEIAGILRGLEGNHPQAVFSYVAKRNQRNPKSGATTVKGQRYKETASGFKTWFNRFCTEHCIVDLTIHDLRRTFGTAAYEATGSLDQTADLLGHSSTSATRIYAKSFPNARRIPAQATALHQEAQRVANANRVSSVLAQ